MDIDNIKIYDDLLDDELNNNLHNEIPFGVFWNRQTREIVKSVIPKSNRLLEFPSFLWHGARPMSRYCNKLRITLMFKFI